MNTAMLISTIVVAGACGLSVVSELKQRQLGVWIFKTLASIAFVSLAVLGDGLASSTGQWVVLGLVLSLFGDVLLIPKNSELSFVAGFASFAAAHIAYCLAFVSMGLDNQALLWAAPAMIAFALLVWRWLAPKLDSPFNLVVPLYILVIATMVVLAAGAVGAGGNSLFLYAAIIFALSDLFVARERFMQAQGINTWLGLPLYYMAQVVFALSIANS